MDLPWLTDRWLRAPRESRLPPSNEVERPLLLGFSPRPLIVVKFDTGGAVGFIDERTLGNFSVSSTFGLILAPSNVIGLLDETKSRCASARLMTD